jgi:hypothetical protein
MKALPEGKRLKDGVKIRKSPVKKYGAGMYSKKHL